MGKPEIDAFGAGRLFTLTNRNDMRLVLTDIGAAIVGIVVRGIDVALGYDSAEGYLHSPDAHGAIVGRIANRIGGARITIDGVFYQLDKNDGANSLHGGNSKYFHRIWGAEVLDDSSVKFTLHSPDGDQGLSGNAEIAVTYTLTDANEIVIDYRALADRATALNLTNHVYFNLNGHNAGAVGGHFLRLACSRFSEIDGGLIPTGAWLPVAGTPMDFTRGKSLGADADDDFEQLRLVGGYDHNYLMDTPSLDTPFAVVVGDMSGIRLEVYTDLPGVQLYGGNFLRGSHGGKGGARYGYREGFCLETQFFPNAPRILRAGELFDSRTVYRVL
ncbi:MAG: galactose mutarotase [Clostridiales bacterium]|nr:galactose mutarotase [Clostridiales bacterium]